MEVIDNSGNSVIIHEVLRMAPIKRHALFYTADVSFSPEHATLETTPYTQTHRTTAGQTR